MDFPFFVARRYLISKKSRNAINIISGIAIGGITLVTASLIIILSALNGFSDLVKILYTSFDPDLEITVRKGKSFDPGSPVFSEIKNLKEIQYWSESLEENVLIKKGEQQCIATLKGISPSFIKMSRIDTMVEEGRFTLKNNNEHLAVIGRGIGYLLQAGPGNMFSPLTLYAPKRGSQKSLNPEEGFNEEHAAVSGLFAINDEFDYKYVLVDMGFARELLGYPRDVNSIEIGLAPGADEKKIQKQIENILGTDYRVRTRFQQNEVLYKTLASEKLWTFIILAFILFISIFNVIGSLSMIIIDKKKDIQTLWNLGADTDTIRSIFLYEGLLITFAGAFTGLVMGTLACWAQMEFGLLKLQEGFVVDAYPVSLQVSDFLWVIITVGAIGFLAAWYPVRVFTKRQLLA